MPRTEVAVRKLKAGLEAKRLPGRPGNPVGIFVRPESMQSIMRPNPTTLTTGKTHYIEFSRALGLDPHDTRQLDHAVRQSSGRLADALREGMTEFRHVLATALENGTDFDSEWSWDQIQKIEHAEIVNTPDDILTWESKLMVVMRKGRGAVRSNPGPARPARSSTARSKSTRPKSYYPRYSIRHSTHRDVNGYLVTGKRYAGDSQQRVFVRLMVTAQKVRDALVRGDEKEVSRLLRAE